MWLFIKKSVASFIHLLIKYVPLVSILFSLVNLVSIFYIMLDNSYYITDHLGITFYSKNIIIYGLVTFLLLKLIISIFLYKNYIKMNDLLMYLLFFINCIFFAGVSFIFFKIYLLETHQVLSGEIIFFKSKYTIYYLCKIFTMPEKYKYLLDYWLLLNEAGDTDYVLSLDDINNCLKKINLISIKNHLDELYSSKLDILLKTEEVIESSSSNYYLWLFILGFTFLGFWLLDQYFFDVFFPISNSSEIVSHQSIISDDVITSPKDDKVMKETSNSTSAEVENKLEVDKTSKKVETSANKLETVDVSNTRNMQINELNSSIKKKRLLIQLVNHANSTTLTPVQRTLLIDDFDRLVITPKLASLNLPDSLRFTRYHNILNFLEKSKTMGELKSNFKKVNMFLNHKK